MQTAALVNRLLCAHDGRMELEDLYGQLSGLSLKDEVENVLKDTDMFVTTGEENKVVVAKTRLRLCRARECQGCSNLHLCKMYLLGDCPYDKGRRCRFCHDLCSEYNSRVLQEHNLLGLDRSELCVILLQNDNTLLPPVCFTYNKGSGAYGNCPDKDACSRLHVCENYIRGTCDGSTGCSRSHDFYEPHSMKNFAAKRVPTQLMGSMLPAYSNRLIIWDANRVNNSTNPINAAEKSEICLFHIRKYCKWGNGCQRVHFNLPYKWEGRDEHNWKILPDNEEVEQAFCDPAKTYSDGTVPVYFDTMTQGFTEVRRLSTLSSVLNPTFILTTTWIWYWEEGNGNWIKYGSPHGTQHKSSITSEDLERKYQEDSRATVEFTAGQHCYELNMQDMMQYNRQKGTKRAVRRRPVFLSADDVQQIKTRGLSQNYRALPHHWDKTGMPETGFKRVPLKNTSQEYKKIIELFNQTMSGFIVKSIERVQNRDLWDVFQWQGDVMKKKAMGKENEKLLFHGTEWKHIDAICQQNFDWRICGVHGTAYGKGSYFARDAKYSHNYTDKSGTRCVFVCRVLVGEYTNGDLNYVRPPLKDGEDTVFYDSCVNDINNPSIFVVFEKHQVYPEYLIQYEEEAEKNHEHAIMEEFSQMSLASLDEISVPHLLSPYSSYSSITSEESVEPECPDPASVTVSGPPVVPKFRIIRQRGAIRSFPARLKIKSLKYGTGRLATRSHLSRTSVKNSAHCRTHQRSLGSLSLPGDMPTDTNTSMSLRTQNARQEGSNLSSKGPSPITSSADLSTHTKTSRLRNKNARQNRLNVTGSAKRLRPITAPASLSGNASNLASSQNARRKQQKGARSAKGLNPVTLGANLSTDTNSSKSVGSQNARQDRPNMTRTSGVTKTSGSRNTRQDKPNLNQSKRRLSPVMSSASSSTGAKTSNSPRSQNAKQRMSDLARSCRGSSPVNSSGNLPVDIKTSKSGRNPNAKQELSKSAGGLGLVASSAKWSGDAKTSKPVRTEGASQQKSSLSRSAKGPNPVTSSASSSLSTRSNISKPVKSDSVKTQSTSTHPARSKNTSAPQKSRTTTKGSKNCTQRR